MQALSDRLRLKVSMRLWILNYTIYDWAVYNNNIFHMIHLLRVYMPSWLATPCNNIFLGSDHDYDVVNDALCWSFITVPEIYDATDTLACKRSSLAHTHEFLYTTCACLRACLIIILYRKDLSIEHAGESFAMSITLGMLLLLPIAMHMQASSFISIHAK